MTTPPTAIPLILGTRNRKKGVELAQLIAPPWEPNPRLARLAVRTLAEFPDVARGGRGRRHVRRQRPEEGGRDGAGAGALGPRRRLGPGRRRPGGAPGVLSARYAGGTATTRRTTARSSTRWPTCPTSAAGAAFVCAWPGRPRRHDPARGRGGLPRPDHPRAPRGRRVRLRPAVPDPRVSQDVRRAERAGQAPAQPPLAARSPASGPALDRLIAAAVL